MNKTVQNVGFKQLVLMFGGWESKAGQEGRVAWLHGKCVSVATRQCSPCDIVTDSHHKSRSRGEVKREGLVTLRNHLILATSVLSQDGYVPK